MSEQTEERAPQDPCQAIYRYHLKPGATLPGNAKAQVKTWAQSSYTNYRISVVVEHTNTWSNMSGEPDKDEDLEVRVIVWDLNGSGAPQVPNWLEEWQLQATEGLAL